ncbi:ABC transporter substrate-binding protein [Frankia sp. AgKG'84/4]|uniref:ABC transporter substrate-binding protein n=1 Tax=Frankia sp. AgKG'84/4 TaxID=573490 RepID=UPI00202A77A2|nr:ABC transporter substrate-binding protein [Frankia sp. AgKG'84/4]MCL9795957.1 ABC transporter substrate-binding protein [Frankia sp. AgKG'84/4]
MILVLSAACTVGLAACSSSSGGGDSKGSGGGGTVTVDPALNKQGPDHGWSQTNVTLDPKTLACNGPASNPTRGITPTSIKLGGLASLTSPAGTAFGDVLPGAKARFERANAEGGVAGRKIDFIGVRDDGSDGGRTADQARAVVEKDQVFAAVPVNSTSANNLDAFCKATMPFFGWGTTSAYCGNAIGFGITGCQSPPANGVRTVDTGGSLVVAKLLSAGAPKTIGMVGLDNESAKQGMITVGQGFESAGFKVVYQKAQVPLSGLTDATPIVNSLMKSDGGKPPTVIFYATPFGDAIKLATALKASGFKGYSVSPLFDPRVSSIKALDDSYALTQWQPGIPADLPANAQMIKDLEKYSPGTAVSLTAMVGYWSADMVVKALEKTGRNLTVDSFLKTLNTTSYTNYVPNVVPETRWPLNHIASSPCATLVHLKDGKWTAPPLACGAITKAP